MPATSERLGAHPVLNYAVVDGADMYRRIMRILYLEHQAFGLRLRPAQVADRLRERYELTTDLDWLEERLAALNRWGAVERDHDASLASTAAEWRRNRYTYDVTSAGRATEELLQRLDALGEEIGRLDTARLPSIRDALARLVAELTKPSPDGTALRGLFERVLAEVEALHAGALSFMRSLGDLMRTVERVGDDEFECGKAALLEHLQGFRRSRMDHSAEILGLLDRLEEHDPAELVARIVAAEQFVALPGRASAEDQRARRRAELLERWRGLRAWFVGDHDSGSPWRTLNDQVVDAIRAVLSIAERLIERRSTRIDRAAVLLHLAGRIAAEPPGKATAWVRVAFGLRTPRHIGAPEAAPDQLPEPGRASWLAADPAPVVAHLRRPGAHRPGRGRSARIPDLAAGRAALFETPRGRATRAGRAASPCGRSRPRLPVDVGARRPARVRVPARLDRPRLRKPGRPRRHPPRGLDRRSSDNRAARPGRAPPRANAPSCPARNAGAPQLHARGRAAMTLRQLDDQAERTQALRALLAKPLLDARTTEYALVRLHERELAKTLQSTYGYQLEVASTAARASGPPTEAGRDRPIRVPPGSVSGRRRPPDEWPSLSDRGCLLLMLTLVALERIGTQTAIAELARDVERAAADVDPPVDVDFNDRRERLAFADGLDVLCDWGAIAHTSGSRDSYARREQRDDEALFTIDHRRLALLVRHPAAALQAGTLVELANQSDLHPSTAEGENRARFERLARRLTEDPVLLLADLDGDDRAYFLGQRARIEDAVSGATGSPVERRSEGSALISDERDLTDVPFPTNATAKQAALLLCDTLADCGPGGELSTEAMRDAVRRLVAEHGEHWSRDPDDPGHVATLAAAATEVLRACDLIRRSPAGAWQPTPLAARFRAPTLKRVQVADGGDL